MKNRRGHGPAALATEIDLGGGRRVPASVRILRRLGRGRAAEVHLAEATWGDQTVLVAEKHFMPGMLPRAVYAGLFAAPFPYEDNRDAVMTCLHRRRVVKTLMEAEGVTGRVAEGLYVRTCPEGHLVLGTEWIEGRPVAPGPSPDPFFAGSEMEQLIEQMKATESFLIEWGFDGSGWQVAPGAIVSTANFLFDGRQFVGVDLESGFPALLVPAYLWRGARSGRGFLFDDLDPARLERRLLAAQERLQETLGEEGWRRLREEVERLLEHHWRWKESEAAPARHRFRLLTDRGLRGRIRDSLASRWSQRGWIDRSAEAAFRSRSRLFLHHFVILAMLPGSLALQLAGSQRLRESIWRRLRSPRALLATLARRRFRRVSRLVDEGRLPVAEGRRLVSGPGTMPSYWLQSMLGRVLPAGLQRLLTDWTLARGSLSTALRAPFSSTIQAEILERHCRSSVDLQVGLGRLTESQATALLAKSRGDQVEACLGGFANHLVLKSLSPALFGVKAAGLALFVLSPWSPLALAMIFPGVPLRALATSYRWWIRGRGRESFRLAFLVGLLPTFGVLAFPFELLRRRPALGRFLLRSMICRLAEKIPVYGGAATRIEIALAHAVDRALAFLLLPIGPAQRLTPRADDSTPIAPAPGAATIQVRTATSFVGWAVQPVNAETSGSTWATAEERLVS